MAKKLDDNEIVTFEELLLANSAQVDTAVQQILSKRIKGSSHQGSVTKILKLALY